MTTARWQQLGELDVCRDLLTKDDCKIFQRLADMRARLDRLRSIPLTESFHARLTEQQHEYDELVRTASVHFRRVAELQARERELNFKTALLRLQHHAAFLDSEST